MKIKFLLFTLLFSINYLSFSQSLETVKTYYDRYAQTQLKEVYTVKANTPTIHGNYKLYDEYGHLLNESTFKNNIKNGKSTGYIGANLASIYGKNTLGKVSTINNYSNGELNGTQTYYSFDTNGKQYTKSTKVFENGVLLKNLEFFSDGQTEVQLNANGACFVMYDKNQKKESYSMSNGKIDGYYKSWYENGQLELEGQMKADGKVGIWKAYYPSGNKKTLMEMDDNSIVIYHEDYFENGQKKWELRKVSPTKYEETTYNDTTFKKQTFQEFKMSDKTDPPSKVETGLKIEYYSNGQKKSEMPFLDGIKTGEFSEYYANGQLKSKVQYQENMKLGQETSYYSNGQVKSILSYKQKEYPSYSAVMDGEATYYHKNGNLKVKGIYKENERIEEWKYLKDDGSIDFVEFDKPNRFGSAVRVKKTGEEIEAQNAKAKYDENKELFIKEQEEVKQLYLSVDQIKSELMDKEILKADKKWLHNAYEIYLNDIITQINSTDDYLVANKHLENGLKLTSLMKNLHKEETKDLEKELKKEEDISKIKTALKLN
jgi:antitoxin component YwqK of YwqJK toxin-antitoxin module